MQLSRQCPFPLHLAIYAEADIVGFKQYLLTVDCALVEAGAARIGGTGNVGSDVTCHILGISVADENLPRRKMLDVPVLPLCALDGRNGSGRLIEGVGTLIGGDIHA